MLKKENRLLKNSDFRQVFKKGKTFKKDFLIVKSGFNEKDNTRLGFIVSLKVSKKAVERNRIKRILRDIVEKRIDKIKKGLDIVVITLPEIKKRQYKEIEKKLENILKESKLLND